MNCVGTDEMPVVSAAYGVGEIIISVPRFDGTIVSKVYDEANRLNCVSSVFSVLFVVQFSLDGMRHATNGVLRSFAYQYNNAGMITNVARETATESVAYGYDSLDRLTSASASYLAATYSWDLVGNPVSRSENGTNTSYTLGAGNKLVTWTGGSYGFDNAGCVTNITRGGDTISLSWDSRYQLASVSTNGTVAEEYVYGPLGRRVTTVANGVTNHHIYNGAHVVADLDADGDLIRSFQTGPGVDNWLGMTVHTGATPIVYYYLTDHIGTVHAVADANGDIVESYRYDPHGKVLGVWGMTGTPLTQSAIGNRILWQGREYSWATGLYYFRARWYDPATGRWLSNDPIGISGGLNQYVFCGNTPVNFKDPFGLAVYVKGSPEERQALFAALRGVLVGSLTMSSSGRIDRTPSGDDCDFDTAFDRLASDELHDFVVRFSDRAVYFQGGFFEPSSAIGADGNTIGIASTISPHWQYDHRAGVFSWQSVPETVKTILAHELGHAITHVDNEPNARRPANSLTGRQSDRLEKKAIEWQNLVMERLGKPRRDR